VLAGECRPETSEVVVTVAHGMILKDELAGERSIASKEPLAYPR
jgi:hypothetical protein